jgi:hypothetical protein
MILKGVRMYNINERIEELRAIASQENFLVKEDYEVEHAVYCAERALAKKALAIINDIKGKKERPDIPSTGVIVKDGV